MNLRVLKKLSKKAAVLLPQIMPRHHNGKDLFLAAKGENYHGLAIERPHNSSHGRKFTADLIVCHPLKGTPMIGGMDGGEQPEWWEKTQWEIFSDMVWWGNIDDSGFDGHGWPYLKAGIRLETPADYLREGRRMIAEGRRP